MARTTVNLRLLLLAAPLAISSATAQTTAMPTPTPVPANSIPSYPAATAPQMAPTPPATIDQPIPQPPQTTPAPPYKDPLLAPIVVPPATTSTPAATSQPNITEPIVVPPATTPATPTPDLTQPIVVAAPQPAAVSMPPQQTVASLPSMPAYDLNSLVPVANRPDTLGSTYIPVDSIIYPLALRLYSLGYLDTAFIGVRPWTRRSLLHALNETIAAGAYTDSDQAAEIVARLMHELAAETPGKGLARGRVYGVESVYTRFLGLTDTPLRDSYHLGQTIVNDYGRPNDKGFNNVTGFTSVNEMGRFSLYVRGEFQHSAAGEGYSLPLATYVSCGLDSVCPVAPPNYPQDTVPYGATVRGRDTFRIQEANLSYHLLGHEISFGKSDAWIGPGLGGAMAFSNNAEDIYSFRINRVEPGRIPYLSRILGPIRYDFFVGSLKGHTDPNDPWVHSEMFAFAPSSNFQFGFQRTVIWGGKGHEPITIHTFLKSFFDINDTTGAEKFSTKDPGARFTSFHFSYRLPFLRKYVTLYTDSIAHDDVTPPSAPRRAAYRPGIFLSQFPHLPKLDFRAEAVSTDISTLRSLNGQFNYYETVQLQGYTNKGFIMGDWIGREAKGGQAWLTYHLSGDEWVQLEYLNKKTPKDFVALGTTQNQFKIDVVKNLGHNISMDAWFQYERWKAPVYKTGQQSDSIIAAQFTWRPKLHTQPTPAR